MVERNFSVLLSERVDRSHPPLGSGVSTAELTGTQRVEVRATGYAVSELLFHPRIFGNLDAIRGVNYLTDSVTSLDGLEKSVRQTYGKEMIKWLKDQVRTKYGCFEGVNPDGCEFAVRETLVQWSNRTTEPENEVDQNHRGTTVFRLVSENGGEKNGFKPAKSGIPRGPGSYSGENKQTRKRKRRNGRGLTGKGL